MPMGTGLFEFEILRIDLNESEEDDKPVYEFVSLMKLIEEDTVVDRRTALELRVIAELPPVILYN